MQKRSLSQKTQPASYRGKHRSIASFSKYIALLVVVLIGSAISFLSLSNVPTDTKAQASTNSPQFLGVTSNVVYPADVFNITNWYLTLPTGIENDPDTVSSAQLQTFSNQYFKLNDAKNGIVFTAHTGGATTSGSDEPRSELREMVNNGATKAAWSTFDGKTHSMLIDQAVLAVPTLTPSVIVGQIHDEANAVIMIRFDRDRVGNSKGLHISATGDNGKVLIPLDPNYQLGTRFTIKFEVLASSPNMTDVYYNGVKKLTLPRSYKGAYFKAGMYTQSSCIVTPAEDCNSYGQSVLFNAVVCHDNVCTPPLPSPTPVPTPSPTPSPIPTPTPVPTPSPTPSPSPTIGVVTGVTLSSPKSGQINAAWNAYPGTKEYKVNAHKDITQGYSTRKTTTLTNVIFTALTTCVTYNIKVDAYNSANKIIATSQFVPILVSVGNPIRPCK